MQALAQDYVVVAESSDKERVYAGSPGLARLPSGELVASYEWFRAKPLTETIPNQTEVRVSGDGGATWELRGSTDIIWPSTFTHDGALYMIGNRRRSREVMISSSEDGGYTWTPEVEICDRRSHGAPTAVTFQAGQVYRAFETCPSTGRGGGGRSSWESFVMAGDLKRDLLDPASWRASPQERFPGAPPGLNTRSYPADTGTEDCWIEGNIISVQGQLRNLLRVHLCGRATVGMNAICDLDDDGSTMRYRFSQFCPMLGGQCKFHILYDEPSGLFWSAVNPVSDSYTPVEEKLRAIRFQGIPGNERRILMLIYSADAQNWFQAGCVAMSRRMPDAFSYASSLVDGADLLVLSRTSVNAYNQHNGNLITLHRVCNFRDLALDLSRDFSPST